MVWLKFIVCAAFIFFAGRRLAEYADIIAEKTGLGGVWIGLVLVAFATSLPELFTGVGSILFVNAPDLTVGNVIGANTYNLLNIGVLDLFNRGGPLLRAVSSGQILTAALSVVPILIATVAMLLAQAGIADTGVANIGIFSIAIFVSYCAITRVIYRFERKKAFIRREGFEYRDVALKKAYLGYAAAASVIVLSGIWLAYIGKELSEVLRLGESFVGSLLMGFATTLPEITVSIAALSIGARDIAVSNMLGSNLFNMTIIFVDDILYRKAPLLGVVSPNHILPASVVMVMTAVVILAMAAGPRKKILGMSWYVPALFAIFLLGAYFGFMLKT